MLPVDLLRFVVVKVMQSSLPAAAPRMGRWRTASIVGLVGVAIAVVAAAAFPGGWAAAKRMLASALSAIREPRPAPVADGNSNHDHPSAAKAAWVELSPQAIRNIGLTIGTVALQDYEHSIAVPAMVVERPGRTRIRVAAPLTGRVAAVFVGEGQAVAPGDLLFTMTLTHEELVQTQTEFLKTLEALDVENRELARLETVAEGAIARKAVLEREYERQKLEALLRAQREALLLHGLAESQVQRIVQERRLIRELPVVVPEIENHEEEHHFLHATPAEDVAPADFREAAPDLAHPLVVQSLAVNQGDVAEAGAPLCVLVDLNVLYIEGRGFEQDAQQVFEAASRHWPVKAVWSAPTERREATSPGLEIVYVANEVEPESRAFHFYVALPNRIVRDVTLIGNRRFVTWKYKPGQRLDLLVPVAKWTNKIVLPVGAVAEEGPEAFVFVQNGSRFERRPVHVEHRDRRHAVVAHDGSLFPGERVALSNAHQLHLAIKNQSGGGADPHAGHNH